MNSVFWFMVLVLGVDAVLMITRKKDPSARKIHAVFSGIAALIGLLGAVYTPFALRSALRAEQAAASYIDETFVQGIMSICNRFFLLITVLCLLAGAAMLLNGVYRRRKQQLLLWCVLGTVLQLVTLFCGLNTINAYFDAAIYMNSMFLFEAMVLHLINAALYLWEKKSVI